jgi:hypothetical protein
MVEKSHVHFEKLHAHFEKCLCCSVTTPDFLFTTPYKKLSTTVCFDEDVTKLLQSFTAQNPKNPSSAATVAVAENLKRMMANLSSQVEEETKNNPKRILQHRYASNFTNLV